jgi:hypothetical protein
MTPYGHLHRHNGSSFAREVCRIALCLDETLRWNLQPILRRGILQDFQPISPNPSIGHGKESFRRPYFIWNCRSSSVRESADLGDIEINRLFHFGAWKRRQADSELSANGREISSRCSR